MTYGAETGIPEDADLAVSEILPDENGDASTSSAYEEYVSKTENVLGLVEGTAKYAEESLSLCSIFCFRLSYQCKSFLAYTKY